MSSTTVDEVNEPTGDFTSHDAPPKRLGLALFVICAAPLMIVLGGTIGNIALPHIETDLGFSQANLQWVITIYTLAFGGVLLLGGRLGDLYGRRRMFFWGIVLFTLASLVAGLAQNETMMLVARAVQGLGGALAAPNALALITTTFPAGKERNRAMGVFAAMSGAGAAIGLILGGALTEIDWRWNFFINLPIGIVVAVLALRILTESEGGRGSLDIPGAITSIVGLSSLVYGLTHAASTSWSDATTVAYLAVGAVLLVAFVVIETRVAHPLLPVGRRAAPADAEPRRPHPRHVLLRDAHRGCRDVRHVLLPRHLHPDYPRLLAAHDGPRLPALLDRHRRGRAGRVLPHRQGGPALDRRRRCRLRHARHVGLHAPDAAEHLHRGPAALDRRAGLRPRPDLRSADPDGRPWGRPRGL